MVGISIDDSGRSFLEPVDQHVAPGDAGDEKDSEQRGRGGDGDVVIAAAGSDEEGKDGAEGGLHMKKV